MDLELKNTQEIQDSTNGRVIIWTVIDGVASDGEQITAKNFISTAELTASGVANWQTLIKQAIASDALRNLKAADADSQASANGVYETDDDSTNLPDTELNGILEAYNSTTQKFQRYTCNNAGTLEVWVRNYSGSAWSDWKIISEGDANIEFTTQGEVETADPTENTKVTTILRVFQGFIYWLSNSTVSALNTTSKFVVGAINELLAKFNPTIPLINQIYSGEINLSTNYEVYYDEYSINTNFTPTIAATPLVGAVARIVIDAGSSANLIATNLGTKRPESNDFTVSKLNELMVYNMPEGLFYSIKVLN